MPEVSIYFNGQLIRGNRSTKRNADGFDAFDSFNYPRLCDVGVNIRFHEYAILKPNYSKPTVMHKELNPNIVILSLFPGIQENITKHIFDAPELEGVIIRSYGSGNAPHQQWLMNLLSKASEKVEMYRYETGHQLQSAGAISGFDSTVEAAATKLMHLKAMNLPNEELIRLMQIPLAGEITI